MSHNLESEMGFLKRDTKFDTVKPYSLRFALPDNSPRHNLDIEKLKVIIHDARPFQPTIKDNGFTLTCFPTAMQYMDFHEDAKIENVYAPELKAHLQGYFTAPHVRIIDYAVRRRHPDFPASTGKEYKNQQPAGLVHLDFSHDEGIKMLRTLYGHRADEILQYRWQIINVWRPLQGPLFDWPLAVCDAQTFDQDRDAQISDAVYPEWAYENVLVHFHPDQKWYYFSELRETETMLFKCTDSDRMASGPCPHAAFRNPEAGPAVKPRESIESRAFVLWAPMDQIPEEVGTLYGNRN